MSIANEISVRSAARKETSEARSVNVTWVLNERRNAINVTPQAVRIMKATSELE
ncbi:hypothetical protein PHLCEN_2v8172 [Hermanssonia centrifuga]|uniref:Uncharacterized protein n=1 Tax=Hermanssonia centrifuga TaxID=98765 RepID=A0A2R6NUB1_9APHY|nr:hypothetical protein PHLCEN_2v8172 [Hermanssonia centrifuga]